MEVLSMAKTVTSLFQSQSQASSVVRRLEEAGISFGDISMFTEGGTDRLWSSGTGTGYDKGVSGPDRLASYLEHNGVPTSDAHAFAEGVRRGNTLVAVRCDDDEVDEVVSILDGNETLDLDEHGSDLSDVARELTGGRGPDSVVDAVGMEAHGSPVGAMAQRLAGFLPDAVARPVIQKAGIDRLAALLSAIDIVRRGGTISLSGVYGGAADPLPMMQLFDKQLQLRMGQANVWRWVDDILPLLTDDDPLGVDSFATHHVPLTEAPEAYKMFQQKRDGAVKVIFQP